MFLWLYGLLRQEKSGDCGNSGLDTSWYDNYSTCSAKKNTKQKSAHKRLKKVQDLIQVNNFHNFCYYRPFLTLLAALSQNKA